MENKKKPTFPKNFFTKPRPTITSKEALKDVIPFKWSDEVLIGKKEAILYPTSKKITSTRLKCCSNLKNMV